MIGTLALWIVGAAVVCSVGWFIFCWRTAATGSHDPGDVAAIVEAHTQPSHVRVVPGDSDHTIDRACFCGSDHRPADAGHVTVGQALGVVLLTVAFLAAMALVGAVETAGLTP